MFIVIEGIDGAGCETQGKNLVKMFKKQANLSPALIKYPDYERNVGKLIKDFLYQNKKLSAEQQFLLYSLQFLMDKKMITEIRKNGILIADRYFSTTLCYQTLEGVNMTKAVNFANDFAVEKPDAVIYLNVNPEIAIKRKFGEKKEKNFREKDFEFIRKTHKQYDYLIKNQVWTKWIEVDGNKSVDEVTKEIYNKIINL
jgi:dTMP kinase